MNSKSPAALLAELKSAFARRDRTTINAIVAELVAQDAAVGHHWRTFADVMIRNGENDLARRSIEKFVRHEQGAPLARFHQASVLARTGDERQARAILAALPPTVPDAVGNAYSQGTIELNFGNIDDAREHLLRAVAANPQSGQCWLALAMTGRLGGSNAIAQSLLVAGAGMAAAAIIERAQYGFARGKILDELDERGGAFAAWTEAGALMLADRHYDPVLDVRSADAAVSGYDQSRIAAIAGKVGVATARPIFVTGSPRSGTTLIEQILASHSAVAGGTELGKFGLLLEQFGGAGWSTFDQWLLSGGTETAAAADYLHLFSERFGANGRAVDKTPDASRYLGLVAALLPDAPLIWLRRDRLDTALSCFRTYFFSGAGWSFAQQDMARHFRLEDELLDRWQDILGDRLLVVDYEALVSDPGIHIRRLLDHCGLAFEPQVLEPHKTERVITTASVTQVREPINRRAIGGAERYREKLDPFIEAYHAAGGTMA